LYTFFFIRTNPIRKQGFKAKKLRTCYEHDKASRIRTYFFLLNIIKDNKTIKNIKKQEIMKMLRTF